MEPVSANLLETANAMASSLKKNRDYMLLYVFLDFSFEFDRKLWVFTLALRP